MAAALARLGCRVVDADLIGHQLLAAPAVRRQLRRRWGAGVFAADGQVDRKALAAIVFADAAELEALNRILHPRIRRGMKRQIAQAVQNPAVRAVVVDAAVLLEAGWDKLCTHLVFVWAPTEVRARRVAEARGWSRRHWRQREKSQISLDSKRARCHYVLENCSDASLLAEQTRQLLHELSVGSV